MTHTVFHVVTKDIKKNHIANDMHPTAMQERRGNQGMPMKPWIPKEFYRHDGPMVYEALESDIASRCQLQVENIAVGDNERPIYKGRNFSGDIIAKRNH